MFGAVALVALSACDWRRAVKGALVLTVLEGAIRKWLLPQASDLIYFLKDAVLLGAYLRYFLIAPGRPPLRTGAGIKFLALAATIVVAVQAFNLRLGSPVVGLFGFKAYLWYVPLCFMVPALFRSEPELQGFLRNYLLLAIPVCLLGIAQFFASPDSAINTYVATGQVSTFGEEQRARITGTFSYITGHSTYLFVCFLLLLAQIARRPTARWFLISLGEMILVVGNMLMTGSRAPVLAGAIAAVGFVPLACVEKSVQQRSPVGVLVLAILICSALMPYLFDEATEAFWQRATGSDNVTDRITGGFLDPWKILPVAGVIGYGAGATHPGGEALRLRLGLPAPAAPTPAAEAETVRVLLELGAGGFFVWYALRVSLLWALWRTWQSLQTPSLRHLALSAFLVHAIQISGSTMLNHTFGVYYWFLAGFIFLLPRLDVQTVPAPAASRARPRRARWSGRHQPGISSAAKRDAIATPAAELKSGNDTSPRRRPLRRTSRAAS